MCLKLLSLTLLLNVLLTIDAVKGSFSVKDGSFAMVSIRQSKFRTDGLEVEIKTDHNDHYLSLTKAESIWSKDAKMMTMSNDGTFVSEPVKGAADVYHDNDKGSIVSIKDDQIDGIIDHEYSIRCHEGAHYVIKADNDDDDYDDYVTAPTDEENNFSGRSNNDDENDYVTIQDELNFENQVMKAESALESRIVSSVVVEVLAVIDFELASQLGCNSSLMNYISVFYNAVNRRYATIESPQIRIELVGVYVAWSTCQEPFVQLLLQDGYKVQRNTLYIFANWVGTHMNALKKHDIAFLHTGRDIYSGSSSSLEGDAYLCRACRKYSTISYSVGIGEDRFGFYKGVHTCVHEIGHLLGAYNDGSGTSRNCTAGGGYIMDSSHGNRSKLFFSNCSIKGFYTYFQSSSASCLLRDDAPAINTGTGLPGMDLNMNEQCQKWTDQSYATVDTSFSGNELCVNLRCKYTVGGTTNTYTTGRIALEGSPCPDNSGYCYDGECRENP